MLGETYVFIFIIGICDLVQERLNVLARLYSIIQNRLSESNRLELDAFPLPNITSINSSHSHIRRLIFLRQYEMLYSLRSIQQLRFDENDPTNSYSNNR